MHICTKIDQSFGARRHSCARDQRFLRSSETLGEYAVYQTTASAEQVAKAWAKEHGYKLVSQGQEAAYRLGLQTQTPMKAVYWSNGPTREFRIGNQVVEVRHVSSQKLRWEKAPEGALLRALLVTPPESVSIPDLKKACQRLSLTPEETREVANKLSTTPLLNAWQSKLQQLEQTA